MKIITLILQLLGAISLLCLSSVAITLTVIAWQEWREKLKDKRRFRLRSEIIREIGADIHRGSCYLSEFPNAMFALEAMGKQMMQQGNTNAEEMRKRWHVLVENS